MEVEPPRQHHDFRRDRGDRVPGDLAEAGEEEVRPGVDPLRATEIKHRLPGSPHVRRVRIVAVQLQNEVTLDGRTEIDPRSRELSPSTVRTLLGPQRLDDPHQDLRPAAVGERRGLLLEDPLHEDVLALQDRVALEFTAPVTVVMLKCGETVDGPRPRDLGLGREGPDRIGVLHQLGRAHLSFAPSVRPGW